jgi:O-antigen ligase
LFERLSKDGAALLAVFLVLASILFGGRGMENPLSMAIVEIIAIPLLMLCLWRLFAQGGWRSAAPAIAFVGLIFLIPLLQLIPLPPHLYAAAPGRAQAAAALGIAGIEPGWQALSLYPDMTRRAALALLAPAAMFLATLDLRSRVQMDLACIYLAGAVLNLVLGVAQLASHSDHLYVSPYAAIGQVSGFFGNRNHIATLLLALLPVAGAVSVGLRRRLGERFPATAALAAYILVTLLALALVQSRFGILAAPPMLVATLLLVILAQPRAERPSRALLAPAAAGALALAVVLSFGLGPIMNRLGTLRDEGRPAIWAESWRAAGPFEPLGAGAGSFQRVYQAMEPAGALGPLSLNQAHNDYIEGWFEGGALAVVVGLVGAALYLSWSWRAWRSPLAGRATLARGASLGLGIIAVHSFFDFPMRTEAIAVLAAFLLGVLGAPTPQEERLDRR